MVKNKDVQKLINDFSFYVIKQNEMIREGNWKEGNKYAKKYIKCYEEIKKLGEDAKRKMLILLEHENDSVKTMAATFLLRTYTDKALQILNQISKRKDIIGFEAKQAIERWEEGTWNLD